MSHFTHNNKYTKYVGAYRNVRANFREQLCKNSNLRKSKFILKKLALTFYSPPSFNFNLCQPLRVVSGIGPIFIPLNLPPAVFRVQIQIEVISDLKRENQFLSKEIWESIKRSVNWFQDWILRRKAKWRPSQNLDSGRFFLIPPSYSQPADSEPRT